MTSLEFTQEVNRVYNFLTEQETEKQQLLNEQKTLSNVLGMNPASGAF